MNETSTFYEHQLEGYRITFNSFNERAAATFNGFKGENLYSDLVLSCDTKSQQYQADPLDDDSSFNAHQILVCPRSGFIKRATAKIKRLRGFNSEGKVVLVIPGVSENAMKQILEYIYLGSIILPKDDMEDFLKSAKVLEIEGLCNNPLQNLVETGDPIKTKEEERVPDFGFTAINEGKQIMQPNNSTFDFNENLFEVTDAGRIQKPASQPIQNPLFAKSYHSPASHFKIKSPPRQTPKRIIIPKSTISGQILNSIKLTSSLKSFATNNQPQKILPKQSFDAPIGPKVVVLPNRNNNVPLPLNQLQKNVPLPLNQFQNNVPLPSTPLPIDQLQSNVPYPQTIPLPVNHENIPKTEIQDVEDTFLKTKLSITELKKAANAIFDKDQNKKTQSSEENPEPRRSVVEDWKQKFPDIKEDLDNVLAAYAKYVEDLVDFSRSDRICKFCEDCVVTDLTDMRRHIFKHIMHDKKQGVAILLKISKIAAKFTNGKTECTLCEKPEKQSNLHFHRMHLCHLTAEGPSAKRTKLDIEEF